MSHAVEQCGPTGPAAAWPGSDPVDPLPTVCEAAPADTLAPLHFPLAVAPYGCPAAGEVHIVPQPLGGTVISSPNTAASSGIISTLPGFPNSYSFSFPDSGTFAYQCRIHDHMTGLSRSIGWRSSSRRASI
jgi:hypothetical protein